MANTHYIGKLRTDQDTKGPFTEARDSFEKAFKSLISGCNTGYFDDLRASICEDRVFIFFGSLSLVVRKDGTVEIVEAAA